jgi:hypothetical protein
MSSLGSKNFLELAKKETFDLFSSILLISVCAPATELELISKTATGIILPACLLIGYIIASVALRIKK